MTTKIDGQLEIDHDRGVIYFHVNKEYAERHKVITLLRVCKIPAPIPKYQHIDLIIEYSKDKKM